ncbi:hypothetical protein [Paenibacillus sonchi]|nr:hypothetical protein [Paenibacillus sonchi]
MDSRSAGSASATLRIEFRSGTLRSTAAISQVLPSSTKVSRSDSMTSSR